jgi:hypothetical protein
VQRVSSSGQNAVRIYRLLRSNRIHCLRMWAPLGFSGWEVVRRRRLEGRGFVDGGANEMVVDSANPCVMVQMKHEIKRVRKELGGRMGLGERSASDRQMIWCEP